MANSWTAPAKLYLVGMVVAACLAKPAAALEDLSQTVLNRAIACELLPDELPGLPAALQSQDSGFAAPVRRYYAPSYNEYAARHQARAFGLASSRIVLQPARIVMLVPVARRARIEHSLRLTPDGFGVSSRSVGENLEIVAYRMHANGVQDSLFLGCQYGVPAAYAWGTE